MDPLQLGRHDDRQCTKRKASHDALPSVIVVNTLALEARTTSFAIFILFFNYLPKFRHETTLP